MKTFKDLDVGDLFRWADGNGSTGEVVYIKVQTGPNKYEAITLACSALVATANWIDDSERVAPLPDKAKKVLDKLAEL